MAWRTFANITSSQATVITEASGDQVYCIPFSWLDENFTYLKDRIYTGSGSPVGVVSPEQDKAWYFDTTNKELWYWDGSNWSKVIVTYLDNLTVNNLTISSQGTLNVTPTAISDLTAIVNKEYVDRVVSSYGVLYYMYDETDTDTGYKLCKLEPSSSAEAYVEKTGLVNDDYIDGWISPSDSTPDRLLKGVYNWNITLEKTDGTQTLRVYWKLFERKSDNTEVEIATSSLSNEITSKETFIVPLQLDDDYILSEGSRIVGKIYASVSGGGSSPSIRIYYQGDTSSRWEIPVSVSYTSNCIPLDTSSPISASISGNQWLSVVTSGIVSLPKQSFCFMYQNTQQTISSATDTKVVLDAIDVDIQNEGDTTNHRITVSETGIYLIIGSIGWYASDVIADETFITKIYKNGSVVLIHSLHTAKNNNGFVNTATIILSLSAGDYIELYAKQNSGTDVRTNKSKSQTYLCVAKIA